MFMNRKKIYILDLKKISAFSSWSLFFRSCEEKTVTFNLNNFLLLLKRILIGEAGCKRSFIQVFHFFPAMAYNLYPDLLGVYECVNERGRRHVARVLVHECEYMRVVWILDKYVHQMKPLLWLSSLVLKRLGFDSCGPFRRSVCGMMQADTHTVR